MALFLVPYIVHVQITAPVCDCCVYFCLTRYWSIKTVSLFYPAYYRKQASVLVTLEIVCCCYYPSSVHGFERSVVSVNEGDMQETFRIRLDIKGNTLDELPQFQVTRINFTVVCQDVTTGEWWTEWIIRDSHLLAHHVECSLIPRPFHPSICRLQYWLGEGLAKLITCNVIPGRWVDVWRSGTCIPSVQL